MPAIETENNWVHSRNWDIGPALSICQNWPLPDQSVWKWNVFFFPKVTSTCILFTCIFIVGVGSRSRRTKPITKRGNVHCDWFVLQLLLPTTTIRFSLDHKRNVSDGVVSGVGRKWKRSDSCDSDSVALVTPLTTPTPTPSLLKTIQTCIGSL